MATPNPKTTRWIRLQRGADQAAAEADAAAAAHEPMTPFVSPDGGASLSPIRVEATGDDEDFGLERSVLIGWRAFFSRFRADECEFEMPHYLSAGRVVEDRLQRLGAGVQPDLITCRMMLELGRQFEEARFRDYNDRVAQLMESCQQLRAQLDVTELSKSHHEDEAAICRDLLRDEIANRGIPVPTRDDGVTPQLIDLLRALLAGLGKGAASAMPKTGATATTPATTASGRLVVDVDARDSLDWTKLHSAAALGRTELIELLVMKGADLRARAKDGSTPLHLAVKRGQGEAVRFLLAHGADATIVDAQGSTPLHLAAEGSMVELIAELASHGAPLNACNGDGWTALHLAANRGHAEMTEALLQAGVDPATPAANGWSALKVALMSGHAPVCDLLRKRATSGA
jgi:ankyrin repeat protein